MATLNSDQVLAALVSSPVSFDDVTADLVNGSVTSAVLADAAVTTAKITDANVTTAKIAAAAVTKAKIPMFIAHGQTGTGSPQNIAHGLGATPNGVLVIPEDNTMTGVTYGTHTSTNVVVTCTSSAKFGVFAIV